MRRPVPGCLPVFVALMMVTSSALSAPTIIETIEHYDVTGSTPQEVRASLNRLGPISLVDGKRYDATVRWHVAWTYGHRRSGNGCAIARAAVTVRSSIIFPRFKTDISTPSDLKRAFATFAGKLMVHEKGHVQNAIDIGTRIEDGIRALPDEATCALLGTAADTLGQALLKEASRMNLDYDTRTGHGRSQGATFP